MKGILIFLIFKEIIFFENFSGGIPSSWQVIDGNNDGYTWEAGYCQTLENFQPEGADSMYAFYDDFNSPPSDTPACEYLISPGISIPTFLNINLVKLKFSLGLCVTPTYEETLFIKFKVFENNSWTNWQELGKFWYSISDIAKFYFPDFVVNSESLKIAFIYKESIPSLHCACGVDNVEVSIELVSIKEKNQTLYPDKNFKILKRNNSVFIQVPFKEFKIEIFKIDGRKIFEKFSSQNKISIKLRNGLYFLKIDYKGKIYIFKIVI